MLLDYAWPLDADPAPLLLALAGELQDEGELLAVRGEATDALQTWIPLGLRREFPQAPVWMTPPLTGTTIVPADGDTAP